MNQVREASNFGKVPLVVVTRGMPDDAFTHAQQVVDTDLVNLSQAGQHHIIAGADHFTLVTNRENARIITGFVRELVTHDR